MILRTMYGPKQKLLYLAADNSGFDTGSTPTEHAPYHTRRRFMQVCRVLDDYFKDDCISNGDQIFKDRDSLVKAVLARVKGASVSDFFRECGRGTLHEDGSPRTGVTVSVGYRLAKSNYGKQHNLDISLCHILKNK